ncbi:MAG: hypothetical protein ACK56I_31730, partial [bacterium]
SQACLHAECNGTGAFSAHVSSLFRVGECLLASLFIILIGSDVYVRRLECPVKGVAWLLYAFEPGNCNARCALLDDGHGRAHREGDGVDIAWIPRCLLQAV